MEKPASNGEDAGFSFLSVDAVHLIHRRLYR
jgi:hypothetical protein